MLTLFISCRLSFCRVKHGCTAASSGPNIFLLVCVLSIGGVCFWHKDAVYDCIASQGNRCCELWTLDHGAALLSQHLQKCADVGSEPNGNMKWFQGVSEPFTVVVVVVNETLINKSLITCTCFTLKYLFPVSLMRHTVFPSVQPRNDLIELLIWQDFPLRTSLTDIH